MSNVRNAGTVFAYGVTSSGKTHTMHVSIDVCYYAAFCAFFLFPHPQS